MNFPSDPRYNYPESKSRTKVIPMPRLLECPRTWMAESLLITLFCFFPLGLPAMWFAAKVARLHAFGDYDGAVSASRKAGMLVKWGLVIGAVTGLVLMWLYFTGSLRLEDLSFTV